MRCLFRVDLFWYLGFVSVMLPYLFFTSLWPPARKGLTFWLLCVMFSCVSITFPCGILGQVWCLVVSISDLCLFPYFNNRNKLLTSKLLKQGYRYHKLLKAFSKFYYRHSELIVEYNICLKTLLQQGISKPEFYGDLVY